MRFASLLTAAALAVASAPVAADQVTVSYGSDRCVEDTSVCSLSRVDVVVANFYGISVTPDQLNELNEHVEILDETSTIPAYTWIYTG